MILRWKSVYEMVFENRVTKAFLRAIPGLDDYALLGKAWFHTTEEKRGKPVWDTVVFDMPASGHSSSMLRVPWVIVDTVPEGPLTRDARTVKELLTDPARTAAVLVTLAEEMPVNEALELEAKLDRARHRAAAARRQPGLPGSLPAGHAGRARARHARSRDPHARDAARRGRRSTRACRAIAARSTSTTSPSSRSAREDAGRRAADAVRARRSARSARAARSASDSLRLQRSC